MWEASYDGLDHVGVVTFDDRLALLRGICAVITTLPEGEGTRVFEEIVAVSLRGLEKSSLATRQAPLPLDSMVLQRIAEEIQILSSWVVGLAGGNPADADRMESGCDTSSEQESVVSQHIVDHVRKGWPYISYYARNFGGVGVS